MSKLFIFLLLICLMVPGCIIETRHRTYSETSYSNDYDPYDSGYGNNKKHHKNHKNHYNKNKNHYNKNKNHYNKNKNHGGYDPYDPSYGKQKKHYKKHHAQIIVTQWDVGGGNFFEPKAKISIQVQGRYASRAILNRVSSHGQLYPLDSHSCQDGSNVNFRAKYPAGDTSAFEIQILDSRGHVIARNRRNH